MDHGRGRGIAAVAAGAIVVLSACSPGGGAADDRAKPAPGPGTPTAPPGFSLERAGAVFLARPGNAVFDSALKVKRYSSNVPSKPSST